MIQRVLIVGSGSAGKRHLEIARALLPQADIRVLRRRPAIEGSSIRNGYFYEIEKALRFSPEIAVITNPAPFHAEVSAQLASTGCHLLVEKPIAESTQGVKNLLISEAANKIVLQVGYNLRFLPSLQKFRQLVHAGSIGRILSAHAQVGQFLPSWRSGVDYRKTVSANAELGGGVLLELSHEIDYLRWIFGEIAWVSAWIGRVGKLEINVEDSANLILGFKGGRIPCEGVATLNMDFIRQDPVRCCLVVGSKSSLRWDGLNKTIEKYSTKSKSWNVVFQEKNSSHQSYTNEWKSFLNCVNSNKKPEITSFDGLAVLKVVQAAKLSHQQRGRRIDVPNLKRTK